MVSSWEVQRPETTKSTPRGLGPIRRWSPPRRPRAPRPPRARRSGTSALHAAPAEAIAGFASEGFAGGARAVVGTAAARRALTRSGSAASPLFPGARSSAAAPGRSQLSDATRNRFLTFSCRFRSRGKSTPGAHQRAGLLQERRSGRESGARGRRRGGAARLVVVAPGNVNDVPGCVLRHDVPRPCRRTDGGERAASGGACGSQQRAGGVRAAQAEGNAGGAAHRPRGRSPGAARQCGTRTLYAPRPSPTPPARRFQTQVAFCVLRGAHGRSNLRPAARGGGGAALCGERCAKGRRRREKRGARAPARRAGPGGRRGAPGRTR